MAVRIISAVVGFPILLFFVIKGGLALQIATTIISLIGMYELYKAVSGKIKPVHILGFIAEIYFMFLANVFADFNNIAVMLLVIIMLLIMIACHQAVNINDVCITLFGVLYIGMMLNCIVLLRNLPSLGAVVVWLPFLCAWGSDTFAYFVGVKFGKHRLAPILSPKKSIEGSVGGIIGAGLLSLVYIICCKKIFGDVMIDNVAVYFVFCCVAGALSQLGDLSASAIKRFTGIKDYGKIMPGHGGVMDRFDSVLFTAPIIYIFVKLIG